MTHRILAAIEDDEQGFENIPVDVEGGRAELADAAYSLHFRLSPDDYTIATNAIERAALLQTDVEEQLSTGEYVIAVYRGDWDTWEDNLIALNRAATAGYWGDYHRARGA